MEDHNLALPRISMIFESSFYSISNGPFVISNSFLDIVFRFIVENV